MHLRLLLSASLLAALAGAAPTRVVPLTKRGFHYTLALRVGQGATAVDLKHVLIDTGSSDLVLIDGVPSGRSTASSSATASHTEAGCECKDVTTCATNPKWKNRKWCHSLPSSTVARCNTPGWDFCKKEVATTNATQSPSSASGTNSSPFGPNSSSASSTTLVANTDLDQAVSILKRLTPEYDHGLVVDLEYVTFLNCSIYRGQLRVGGTGEPYITAQHYASEAAFNATFLVSFNGFQTRSVPTPPPKHDWSTMDGLWGMAYPTAASSSWLTRGSKAFEALRPATNILLDTVMTENVQPGEPAPRRRFALDFWGAGEVNIGPAAAILPAAGGGSGEKGNRSSNLGPAMAGGLAGGELHVGGLKGEYEKRMEWGETQSAVTVVDGKPVRSLHLLNMYHASVCGVR